MKELDSLNIFRPKSPGTTILSGPSSSWADTLFNESDLAIKLDSRSGNILVDSIGSEATKILSIEHISNGTTYYYGDKTRADEKWLDGNSHTFYCKFKQIADPSYVGTGDILCQIGRTSGTGATERGISLPIASGAIQPYLTDGVTRYRPILISDVNNTIKIHEWVEIWIQIDFGAKLWKVQLYDDEGNTIGNTISQDISGLVFNANDNTAAWTFKSTCFAVSAIKKYNSLKTIAQCREDSYISDLRIHYPTLLSGTDVSGNDNHLTVSSGAAPDSIANRVYVPTTTWALDYGYNFERSSNYPMPAYPDYFVPNDFNGNNEGGRFAAIINEVNGNGLHNLVHSKLRFTNAFFDRSNATIWKDAARQNHIANIVLSGTGGTATVTINGVTKTVTFATDIETSANNFVNNDNIEAYLAVGLMLVSTFAVDGAISFHAIGGTRITGATIVNATGDLAGTVTQIGHYDASNPKDFHITELNQRILYEWLNDGYRGRLYVHCESKNWDGTYQGSIEDRDRTLLKGIYLYNTDIKGADQYKVLQYTGDAFAVVMNGAAPTYDAEGYVKIGYLKSPTPALVLSIDDGFQDSLTGWKPAYDALSESCPACTNVHGGNIGGLQDARQLMTWAEIAQCAAGGWEVGSHNYQDNDYSSMTFPDVDADVAANKAAIVAQGYPCKILVGNRTSCYSPSVHYMAWKYGYKASRNYGGVFWSKHGANPKIVDRWHLSALALQGGFPQYDLSGVGDSATEIAAVKAQLDLALADNRIVIFYFHYYTGTNDFYLKQLECIQYAMNLGIEIITTETALDRCKYL